jgi:hypothetical protein
MPKPNPETKLCGAKSKTTGEPCQNRAGKGTSHVGIGRCRHHGGNTASHDKNAIMLETQQRMVAMSVPIENPQPHAVLLAELAYSSGHCEWLRSEITGLEPEEIGNKRSVVLLSRLDTERDRVTRIAQAAASAGVDEAMIQIHQAQAMQMVRAIMQAARAAGIPRDYVHALGAALRQQFAMAAGDEEAAAAQEQKVAEVRERIRATEATRAQKAAQRLAGLIPADEMVIDGRASETTS